MLAGVARCGGNRLSITVDERRRAIEAIVTRQLFATASELARATRASPMTVRRDIDVLDATHRVRKIHGGALAISADVPVARPNATAMVSDPVWQAIAHGSAELAKPNTAVAVNAGPGSVHLARQLILIEGLTVVTNSLAVANVVEQAIVRRGRAWAELILTGGSQSSSGALVGPTAVVALERINPAVAFLSVSGADETIGLSSGDVMEAEVNRAFLRSARQRVALVASAQWGTVALNVIAPLSSIDVLVSDSIAISSLEATNVDLIRVATV